MTRIGCGNARAALRHVHTVPNVEVIDLEASHADCDAMSDGGADRGLAKNVQD